MTVECLRCRREMSKRAEMEARVAAAEQKVAAVEALRHRRVRVRKNGERHDYVRWVDVRAALRDPEATP